MLTVHLKFVYVEKQALHWRYLRANSLALELSNTLSHPITQLASCETAHLAPARCITHRYRVMITFVPPPPLPPPVFIRRVVVKMHQEQ